ncbi:hypothetical protein C8J57DRAFT_1082201, partial [Mycena rebaudengoi]
EETLRTFFVPFGEIHYVKVPIGKRCGFVQFVRKADAERAIEKMQGFPVGGSRIRLSWGMTVFTGQKCRAALCNSVFGYATLCSSVQLCARSCNSMQSLCNSMRSLCNSMQLHCCSDITVALKSAQDCTRWHRTS